MNDDIDGRDRLIVIGASVGGVQAMSAIRRVTSEARPPPECVSDRNSRALPTGALTRRQGMCSTCGAFARKRPIL